MSEKTRFLAKMSDDDFMVDDDEEYDLVTLFFHNFILYSWYSMLLITTLPLTDLRVKMQLTRMQSKPWVVGRRHHCIINKAN